jgi:hypothetical protein
MGTFVANQVVLLIALLCVGEGALLIGREIYWRLRALRVEGIVIGVREESHMMFYSVYRFSLSGESFEATSHIASDSTRGRETGRTVKLLVFAERPDEVSEANSVISGIAGIVLLLAGSWPLYAALTEWPVNAFTWLMLAAVAVYIAQRLRRHLIPEEQRQASVEWRKEREQRRAELAAMPMRRIEDILAAPQAGARRAQKNSRLLAPVLAIVGFGAIYLGAHLGRGIVERHAHGHRVQGSVIALRQQSADDSYFPAVRFVTANGASVEFKDKIGTYPTSYRVGETVTVLYRDTGGDPIIDRGGWNWAPAILLGVLGCCFLFMSIRRYRAAGRN